MRTLCAIEAVFWEPAPLQETLAGIPHSILKTIIKNAFDTEVAPRLKNHVCDTSSPCIILRSAMQICVRFLSVCRTWKIFVSAIMKHSQYFILSIPPDAYPDSYFMGESSYYVARHRALSGRYKFYKTIVGEYEKSVVRAYDHGGPDGCHGKTEVAIKISNSKQEHESEKYTYTWLAMSELDRRYVPHMHFEGRYGSTAYYGLVLDPLGPDLETLRIKGRLKRFTAKMTLAVAIQTVRMYEKLHANGWLHTNAKPGNFAIGPDLPGQATRIYVFDFEWSHRIEPLPSAGAECRGWNHRFKPVSWQLGLTPSRRDDLEGLAYVFSYLERGSHPWQHAQSEDLWRLKISTTSTKLFEGMDPVYVRYFDEVKALAWGEIPDYSGIIGRFVEVWERRGYGGTPGDIDWWDAFDLRKTKNN